MTTTKELVLFPIRIDDAVMETPEPWARKLRDQRNIGDFRQWEDHKRYKTSFEGSCATSSMAPRQKNKPMAKPKLPAAEGIADGPHGTREAGYIATIVSYFRCVPCGRKACHAILGDPARPCELCESDRMTRGHQGVAGRMVYFNCHIKDSFRDSCKIATPIEVVFSAISFLNEIPTSSRGQSSGGRGMSGVGEPTG
jgi:hypothetical protein